MWWHFTLSTLRPTNTRPVQAAMTGELANGGVGDDQKISLLQPWLSVRSSPVLSITPVPALPTPTRGSQDKSIYYETQFSTSTAPALLQLSQARYILHLEICLFPTYDINIVQFIKSLHTAKSLDITARYKYPRRVTHGSCEFWPPTAIVICRRPRPPPSERQPIIVFVSPYFISLIKPQRSQ